MVTLKNKRGMASSLVRDHPGGAIAILMAYLEHFPLINRMIFLDLM
jgi:hypothetical protein